MKTSDVHTIQLSGGNANAIDEALLKTLTDGLRAALDTGKTAVVLKAVIDSSRRA